jgi:predicted ATP-dependent endonuclease of OLD family
MENIESMNVILKSLALKNFKCFQGFQTVNFEKLTVLTGANSSGKSAILAAILGAIQSGEFPYNFSPNGKYVNMGDFTEMSFSHDPNNLIEIGFVFHSPKENLDYQIGTCWRRNPVNHLPELNSLEAKSAYFHFLIQWKIDSYSYTFSYNPENDPTIRDHVNQKKLMLSSFSMVLSISKADKQKSNREKQIEEFSSYIDTNFKKVSIRSTKLPDLERLQFYLSKKGNMRLIRTSEFIKRIFIEFDKTANLISSFRLHPDRTYLEKSKDELKVDKFGDGYLDQIILWERRKSQKFQELLSIMKELGLIYSIRSRRIGGGRFELLLKIYKGSTEVSLFDVGFGVNQFLPIIVADLQLTNNSTLFVAQPEIHLHPRGQASFGNFIAKRIQKNKKNYILETHSEYFLNRIRLLIVKGELKQTDLTVYYLENEKNDTKIHKLEFTPEGEINNAPSTFFDTYYTDIRDISLNSFK